MTEGVDYSWARPNPETLYRQGKRFAVRYLFPSGKGLTAAEVTKLHAAGLSVVLNYEGASGGPRNGMEQGRQDAKRAVAYAVEVGAPKGCPIYFSVDFDASLTELRGCVHEYFVGVASVLPHNRIGIYGSYRTVEVSREWRIPMWFWQTYAWSGGRWSHANHIEQYRNGVSIAGGTVDLDRARAVNYGQWSCDVITDQDKNEIADLVVSKLLAERIHGTATEGHAERPVETVLADVWKRTGTIAANTAPQATS